MSKKQTFDEFLKYVYADDKIRAAANSIACRIADGPKGATMEEELARIEQCVQDEKASIARDAKIDRAAAIRATKAKKAKK